MKWADEIEDLKRQNAILTKERNEATETVKILHGQQCQLYKSFELVRAKYDDLKTEIQHILWDFIPTHNYHEFKNFSELGGINASVFETPNQISNYSIGSLLGEGQFATVKLCKNTITNKEYAVKIISKRKMSTLSSLRRVCNELRVLKQVDHPNIVKFVDFIHSPNNLYLITEIGGKDLFEFFEANPHGVCGETARQIILGIVKPLLYLHQSGICHRDLKPENVLLFDNNKDIELHKCVQICDFGQSVSSTWQDTKRLSGLCGSPGFFAPEMILEVGTYDGVAADIWSVGCITLELSRGHDEFCMIWMTSYDYNLLQNEKLFEQSLCEAVHKIHSTNTDSTSIDQGNACDVDLVDFLRNILQIDPRKRLSTTLMMQHEWLREKKKEPSTDLFVSSVDDENPSLTSQMQYSSDSMGSMSLSDKDENENAIKKKRFRNSFSSRARKHFVGSENAPNDEKVVVLSDYYRVSNGRSQGKIEIRLPPVEPITPSSRAVKRTLMEGKKLANKVSSTMINKK